jgi:sec-independent protein translocase protein TatC
MPRNTRATDPDDFFADTRMSFGDHIEELRTHLIRAIAGFCIGMVVSLIFAQWVFHFITAPVEEQLMVFYNRRVEKKMEELKDQNKEALRLNGEKEVPAQARVADLEAILRKRGYRPAPGVAAEVEEDAWVDLPIRIRPLEWTFAMHEAQRVIGRPPLLSTMNVMEAFMVYFKIAALTGLVISSPWVFWQLWSFIAAGLYPQEKRLVNYYLPVSLALFLAGVLLCEFMVIPKAINALLWFNEWLGLEPDLRLNEWLSFALILPLVFGIAFQTPMVMLFLAKIGVVDADSFRRKRRIAWFVMAIAAAIITPIDAISMLMLMVPMWALYEVGILMVQYTAGPSEEDAETPAPEEMVEV